MSRLRYSWSAGRSHLCQACPTLARFIEHFGAARYSVRQADLFQSLARAIAYQQLSGKAAATIHGRFEALFPDAQPVAAVAAKLSVPQLRATGLSQSKALSILDLATRSQSGELPGPRKLGRMSDAELVEALCKVRGIGPWTVHMLLIFNLGRPDVMPAADLAIQKGIRNVYALNELPEPAAIPALTRHLAPYRSVAAWYFWRASESDLYLA